MTTELARALVRSPWWRWSAGVLCEDGARVVATVSDGAHGLRVLIDGPSRWFVPAQHVPLPCLADAFTLGYIEDRMRDAWVGARIEINTDPWRDEPADARGGWIAADIVRGRVCPQTFSSEDNALVATLEAAPEVPG